MAEVHQSTEALLLQAKEGDPQARERLVLENVALVKYIVRRFLGRGVEYDDLLQFGCMGLSISKEESSLAFLPWISTPHPRTFIKSVMIGDAKILL